MARVKIIFPNDKPLFSCTIPVRISDVNYGNHLGHDSVLSIMHEARMQLLAKWGYTELAAGGSSLIMGDVMIAYRGEAFYGDILQIEIYIDELSDRSFGILYRMSCLRDGVSSEIAHGRTGMICFDYENRKIANMSQSLKSHLQGLEF